MRLIKGMSSYLLVDLINLVIPFISIQVWLYSISFNRTGLVNEVSTENGMIFIRPDASSQLEIKECRVLHWSHVTSDLLL